MSSPVSPSITNTKIEDFEKQAHVPHPGLVMWMAHGETARAVGKRLREHTDGNHPSSAVQEHISLTSHPVSDLVKMLCKEKTRPGGV